MHFQHRATDRLRAISLHTQQQQQPEHVQQLSTNSTSASSTSHHQRTELSRFLNGENTKYRDEVFEFLKSEPIFELDYNLSKEALRHVTRARLQRLVEKGYTGVPPNDSRFFIIFFKKKSFNFKCKISYLIDLVRWKSLLNMEKLYLFMIHL